MKTIIIIQKHFKNDENKIIAFVNVELITADFGAIPLAVGKENKKVFNFLARQNGFVVGETDTEPTPRTIEYNLKV